MSDQGWKHSLACAIQDGAPCTCKEQIPYDDPVRVVFDVAVGSLDFASGFLDLDEVRALRTLAVRLGVDPDKATPSDWLPWRDWQEHPAIVEFRKDVEKKIKAALKGDTDAREWLSRKARLSADDETVAEYPGETWAIAIRRARETLAAHPELDAEFSQ